MSTQSQSAIYCVGKQRRSTSYTQTQHFLETNCIFCRNGNTSEFPLDLLIEVMFPDMKNTFIFANRWDIALRTQPCGEGLFYRYVGAGIFLCLATGGT